MTTQRARAVKTRGECAVEERESASDAQEVRLLGCVERLGLGVDDKWGLINEVLDGFEYIVFNRMVEQTDMTRSTLAELTGIAPRTLSRRKEEGRFTSEESERLLRVARVFGTAEGLFRGNREAARRWLSKPKRALGGRVPLDLVTTEVGAREVEDLIHRIEHGVFT
jgi:putative toxin-antitoxin system antitoxin component (TIGR02293 family)